MNILEILFVAETVTSITDKNINDIINCFWLINDIEIELWKEFIPAGLTAVEFINNNNIFQIFIISKHNYRISNVMNFKASLFKCFNNDQ